MSDCPEENPGMHYLIGLAVGLIGLIGLVASRPTIFDRLKASSAPMTARNESAEDLPRHGWTLRELGESKGTLSVGEAGIVTVAFSAYLPGPSWQTRLIQHANRLPADAEIVIEFEAKADAPRPIDVGVGESGRAGGSLGLRETAQLTTDWQSFEFPFRAKRDCATPEIQFDFGASPVATALRNVRLTVRPSDASAARYRPDAPGWAAAGNPSNS